VSHEVEQVRELCSRAVWLENGVLRMDGDVDQVLAAYRDNDSLDGSRGAS
jgi:ABC-type polysaccharide/polyol phosphate transport system ATPase subunit